MSQPFPSPSTAQQPPAALSPVTSGPAVQAASTDLQACVRASLQAYFDDLGGETPANMYDMVLRLVEQPLLETVMAQADQNQSRAAQWLGLNRNTLRKKLQEHDLL